MRFIYLLQKQLLGKVLRDIFRNDCCLFCLIDVAIKHKLLQNEVDHKEACSEINISPRLHGSTLLISS